MRCLGTTNLQLNQFIGKYKYYELEILYVREGINMERIKRIDKDSPLDEELGFLLWQLEEMENFYPCYKSMLKRGD
jgi:hypothetical protein